jgi:ABC-type Na+ efflux pump permease subunit
MSQSSATQAFPIDPRREAVGIGDWLATWLIARRGALESLRDRTTLGVSLIWALLVPFVLALTLIRPQAERAGDVARLGSSIAIFLLVVGLMPTSGSIGIAAGLFAGEREQGNLLPLLATPASNRAIFAGKVLGAVLPALLYAAVAEANFLGELWLLLGGTAIRALPLAFSVAMVALVPGNAVLGAAVASVVSSRVRTYQSAQMLTSLVMFPIMAALFALAAQMQRWGAWALLAGVLAIVVLDVFVVVLGAATWRREEVMARR